MGKSPLFALTGYKGGAWPSVGARGGWGMWSAEFTADRLCHQGLTPLLTAVTCGRVERVGGAEACLGKPGREEPAALEYFEKKSSGLCLYQLCLALVSPHSTVVYVYAGI